MIPPATVQLIKDTMRVEEVVGDYVNLKRRGANLIGLCPLHGEKTPSFNVSPSKGIFKCFGCGEGGDAISFLQKHDGLDYVGALRHIARKYNIHVEEEAVPEEVRAEHQRAAALQLVNDYARAFYRGQLTDTEEGVAVGLSYLRQRGYTDATIAAFELGYAPPRGDALKRAALDAGYRREYLADLGLVTKDGSRDFLRDRVVFPIHSHTGKVVAFAGRILKHKERAPKYLNSPETELYDKSATLYGLHLARAAIRRADECLITEGYADVIALYQAGVANVVATSGTSLTAGHIRLVKRLTQRVVFLYDGDQAGVKAALRGLDLVLAEGMEVRLVLLPDGHDPDSYVKEHGGEAFRAYVAANAKDFIAYKSDLVLAEAADDPLARARLVHDVLKSVARVPDVILRAEYTRATGERFGMDEATLVEQLNTYLDERAREEQRRAQVAERSAQRELAERAVGGSPAEESLAAREAPDAVAPTESAPAADLHRERAVAETLVRFGEEVFDADGGYTVGQAVCANLGEVLDAFEDALCGAIVAEAYARVGEGATIAQSHWTGHEREDVRAFAATALTSRYTYSDGWWDKFQIVLTTQPQPEANFVRDATQALNWFKLAKLSRKIKSTNERMRVAQEENDHKTIHRLLKLLTRMNAVKREISEPLNAVVIE